MRRLLVLPVAAAMLAGCGLLDDQDALPAAPTGEAQISVPVTSFLLLALPDGKFALSGLSWAGVVDGTSGDIEWAVRNIEDGLLSDDCPDGCLDDVQPLTIGWASKDGIYAFSRDATMRGFDPVGGEIVWEKSTTGVHRAPSPDRRHVMVIDGDGEVEAWSAATGRVEARFQIDLPDGFSIDTVRRSDPNNQVLLVDDDGAYVVVSLELDAAEVVATAEIDAIDEDTFESTSLSGTMLTVDDVPYDVETARMVDLPESDQMQDALDEGNLWNIVGDMAVVKLFPDDPDAGDVRLIDLATGQSAGAVASDGERLTSSVAVGQDGSALIGVTNGSRLVLMEPVEEGFATRWGVDLPESIDAASISTITVGDGYIAMLGDGADGESRVVTFPTG